jgi:hypothetical protein
MTKGRVALLLRIGLWMKRTAGPSSANLAALEVGGAEEESGGQGGFSIRGLMGLLGGRDWFCCLLRRSGQLLQDQVSGVLLDLAVQ